MTVNGGRRTGRRGIIGHGKYPWEGEVSTLTQRGLRRATLRKVPYAALAERCMDLRIPYFA